MSKSAAVVLVCALVAVTATLWLWPRGQAATPEVIVDATSPEGGAHEASRHAATSRSAVPSATPAGPDLQPPEPVAGLHGTVTDADHRPVPGARVSWRVPRMLQAMEAYRAGLGGGSAALRPSVPPPVLATTTDARGAFRLAAVPLGRRGELWVQPPGVRIAEHREVMPSAAQEPRRGVEDRTLDVELARTVSLHCVVRDAVTQAAGAGAAFLLEDLPEPLGHGDASGQLTLLAPLEVPCALVVSAPGHAPIRHPLRLSAAPAEPLVLLLPRGARVTGRVRDAAGTPVPDAEVRLEALPLPAAEMADRERAARSAMPELAAGSALFGEPLQAVVRSAADGRFELRDLAGRGGVFHGRLVATRAGYCDTEGEAFDLDLPTRDAVVELTLFRGGTVTGRLWHLGRGVAGSAWVQTGSRITKSETDAEGVFRLGPLQPGSLTVAASAAQRTRGSNEVPIHVPRGAAQVTVTEGGETQVDLDLDAAPPQSTTAVLSGRVRDGEGKPVRGVAIRGVRDDQPGSERGSITITRVDGAWSLVVTDDPSQPTYTVTALCGDGVRPYEHVRPSRSGLDFTVRMVPLRLDVTCADGTAPGSVSVFVRHPDGGEWWQYDKDIDGRGTTTVLEPGETLELPLGAVDLRIDVLGHAPAELRGVSVTAGAPPLRVVVQRGRSVVLTPTGESEAHQERELCLVPADATGPDPRTRSLRFADGALRARSVTAGRYRVVSTDGELRFEPEFVQVGAEDVAARVRITLKSR